MNPSTQRTQESWPFHFIEFPEPVVTPRNSCSGWGVQTILNANINRKEQDFMTPQNNRSAKEDKIWKLSIPANSIQD